MSSIYQKIEEPEILYEDIVMPENLPVIYIDERDNIYCYHGIVDKDRFLYSSYPYYMRGRKPSEIKNDIRGYFRIHAGNIVYDKEFIDERIGFYKNLKCKIVPAYIHFPEPSGMSFAIYTNKYQEIENELTRKIFGLTYEELMQLLDCYNKTYKICPINDYQRYPSITRSIKSDNFCEINDYWIPAKFPYIAFSESSYYYSHVSLGGFYQTIRFLTLCDIESYPSKMLIANGLNPQIFENLFHMDVDMYNAIPFDSNLCRLLNE